jgi:hypothetical protein
MASTPLSQKLLSLAANLRENGFEKYAQVLENQLISIHKTAAHLYQAHDETGDDVINFAHRDGDKELEKSWGDLGEVETILSRHNKILDVVHREPSLKKKANKNLLNAVKIILSTADNDSNNNDEKIKAIVSEGISYIAQFISILTKMQLKRIKTKGSGFIENGALEDIQDKLNDMQKLEQSATDYNTIMQITKLLNNIVSNISVSLSQTVYLDEGEMSEINSLVSQYLETAKARFNAAFQLLQGHIEGAQYQLQQGMEPSKISLVDGSTPSPASSSVAPQTKFIDDATVYLKSLYRWRQKINADPENTPEDKQAANGWLDKKDAAIRSLAEQFHNLPNEQKEQMSKEYDQKLLPIIASFPQFKQKWIGNE